MRLEPLISHTGILMTFYLSMETNMLSMKKSNKEMRINLRKESLISDGEQFHQFKEAEQSTLT
jgi:hypothetical protein